MGSRSKHGYLDPANKEPRSPNHELRRPPRKLVAAFRPRVKRRRKKRAKARGFKKG